MNLGNIITQNYFTIGVLFVILLAEIAPWIGAEKGPLQPELTAKYLAIAIIFFISGLTLEGIEFSKAIKNIRIVLLVQIFSFFLLPTITKFFISIFVEPFELNSWITDGILLVGCMPPSVASGVVLTKAANGNEAAAIINSIFGVILGIFLTPLLLLTYVGLASTLPIIKILIHLIQKVILPIFVGQLTRMIINKNFLSKIPFHFFIQLAFLFIVYSSFCNLFIEEGIIIDAHHIILTIFIVAIIQIFLIFLSYQLSKFLSQKMEPFTEQDIITIVFCSNQKSLNLGMTLVKTLYGGYSHMHQISLPLLVYHPIQLILGGFLIQFGQKLIKKTITVRQI